MKQIFFFFVGLFILVSCNVKEPEIYDGLENGQAYVDLGLNVCWAKCNVGASKEYETGKYYAWGETEPKMYYQWSNYTFGTQFNKLIKYCSDANFGKADNLNTLEPIDDVASALWKGSWRMPTSADWVELLTKCSWNFVTKNKVGGYEITGPNGHNIFMPTAGFKDSTEVYTAGINGYYWSSSLYTPEPDYAFAFYFTEYSHERYHDYRYLGLTIRPVCVPADKKNYE